MPTSDWLQISKTLDLVMQFQPGSVLDIGIGFGKWGLLLREYLDIWQGRYKKEEWKARIDGVEINRAYRNPVYDFAYDFVYYCDIMSCLSILDGYDLVLLIDVIEHLEKETGLLLLQALKNKYIVCTPAQFYSDDRVEESERHKSLWLPSDFEHSEVIGVQIIGWRG